MKTMLSSAAVLAAMLISAGANADHGRRFLLTTGPGIPGAQERYFAADFTAYRFSNDWGFSADPAFLMGLGDDGMMGLEFRANFFKSGSGPWLHNATGVQLRRKIMTSDSGWNFTAGIGASRDRDGGDTPLNLELIAGKEDEMSTMALNLMANNPGGFEGRTFWTYAAAWSPKRTLMDMGYSIELAGNFEDNSSHTAMFGVMKETSNGLMKLGVGAGLSNSAPDWTIRAGWVMRF